MNQAPTQHESIHPYKKGGLDESSPYKQIMVLHKICTGERFSFIMAAKRKDLQ